MKKKDQWIIHNISTGESRSFDIRTPKDRLRLFAGHTKRSYKRQLFYFYTIRLTRAFKKFKKLFVSNKRTKHTIVEIPQLRWLFSNTVKGGLTVLISVLVIYGVVQAANDKLTPPTGTPVATFYSLSEIYALIHDNNTSATEGSPALDWSTALENTQYTLTQIYSTLASLISADKVKNDTTYLGVTGTLTPDGGTAAVADLFNGKTAHLTNDWTLDIGTLNLACNTATFDGAGNLVSNTYDGAGDGTNRWCITDADDITAANVLSGKIAWINGATTTGTMTNNGDFNLTASSTDQEVAAGYWGAGTLTGDPDLVAGNIANNVNIFGVIGNLVAGYLFGDSDASKVLTSATGNDGNNSYLAANLDENKVKKGISFGVGPIIGLLFGDTDASKVLTTADGGGAAKGTYNASNLSTTTVKKGTTFGVSETGVYSGYPGSGANRAGLTQATCAAASASGWYWFEDANGDGDSANPDDPEDGICVLAKAQTTVGSWNGYDSATNPDSTYIADYTCDGVSFPNGSVSTYSGIDSAGNPDTTWNQGDCALCQADCYDGVKDLPGNGGYKAATGDGGATTDYNGPLTPKVLAEWKGTRLPTSADFFGFCGRKDGVPSPYNSPYDYENTTSGDSSSNTFGNYGVQVGRIDEFLDLANTNWEWLSEQHYYINARLAGGSACSYFGYNSVYNGYRFRAVFRP